jgi:hypothetical protein
VGRRIRLLTSLAYSRYVPVATYRLAGSPCPDTGRLDILTRSFARNSGNGATKTTYSQYITSSCQPTSRTPSPLARLAAPPQPCQYLYNRHTTARNKETKAATYQTTTILIASKTKAVWLLLFFSTEQQSRTNPTSLARAEQKLNETPETPAYFTSTDSAVEFALERIFYASTRAIRTISDSKAGANHLHIPYYFCTKHCSLTYYSDHYNQLKDEASR